jgi:endonuclease/exonuclease/phosphatase family metal-dependent hydrolase
MSVKTLRVGSYNIFHGGLVDLDMSAFAKEINEKELDIVGFQEVDRFTTRVGGIDSIKLLCEACGFEYFGFAKAMDYCEGEYGTGIVSRYPITSFEKTDLPYYDKEPRSYGHAKISFDGIEINFFNTHLSLKNRGPQFEALNEKVNKYKNCILTGDFNTEGLTEFKPIENMLILNDKTYPSFIPASTGIDNILISDNLSFGESGLGEKGNSDHRLLWAEVKFNEEK